MERPMRQRSEAVKRRAAQWIARKKALDSVLFDDDPGVGLAGADDLLQQRVGILDPLDRPESHPIEGLRSNPSLGDTSLSQRGELLRELQRVALLQEGARLDEDVGWLDRRVGDRAIERWNARRGLGGRWLRQ